MMLTTGLCIFNICINPGTTECRRCAAGLPPLGVQTGPAGRFDAVAAADAGAR